MFQDKLFNDNRKDKGKEDYVNVGYMYYVSTCNIRLREKGI